MSFDITFGRGEPLPPDRYRGVLESVELVNTRYDEKLKFVFQYPIMELRWWAGPSPPRIPAQMLMSIVPRSTPP